MPYTDRLNYVSPLINNVGYCSAVEKLLGITSAGALPVHPRDHQRDLAHHRPPDVHRRQRHGARRVHGLPLHDQGARVPLRRARGGDRRAAHDLLRARRRRHGRPRPRLRERESAGVRRDSARVLADVRQAPHRQPHLRATAWRASASSPARTTIGYGDHRPVLRASGVAFDVRKATPYSVYDRLDFEVPVGRRGDNYDRFLVRIERDASSRCASSSRRSTRCPAARSSSTTTALVLPPKKNGLQQHRGLMNHFKLIMDGFGIRPPGRGLLRGRGRQRRARLLPRLRRHRPAVPGPLPAACFPPTAAMPRMIEGAMVADIVPTFGIGQHDRRASWSDERRHGSAAR